MFTKPFFTPTYFTSVFFPIPVFFPSAIAPIILAPHGNEIGLARVLELPMPETLTRILGIHQSDVVIRSAITAALADIRANPWLMDYIFASLPQDTLTWRDYGEKSVAAAKEWFLKTDIPVSLAPRFDESKWPLISVMLSESSEVVGETTLGDVNYEPEEDNATAWPPLTTPFTPISYIPSQGLVKLPSVPDSGLAVGMFIVATNGAAYEIKSVLTEDTFTIDAGVVPDLRNAVLKGAPPSYKVEVESSSFRETYQIGIHVPGDPVLLTWLHSVIVFALMRYKQILLEARGFERTTIQSGAVQYEERFEAQNILSRYITITGNVRQYWPKSVTSTITHVAIGGFGVSGAGNLPSDTPPDSQSWVGEEDALSKPRK